MATNLVPTGSAQTEVQAAAVQIGVGLVADQTREGGERGSQVDQELEGQEHARQDLRDQEQTDGVQEGQEQTDRARADEVLAGEGQPGEEQVGEEQVGQEHAGGAQADGEQADDVREEGAHVEEAAAPSENACVVCLVNDRNAVIIPCGHLCCVACANSLQRAGAWCPICRGAIANTVRISL